MGRFQFRLNKALQKQDQKRGTQYPSPTRFSPAKTAGANNQETVGGRDFIQGNPRLPGFKEKTAYEVILEWDLSQINRPFQFQRIGMQSWTAFAEAVQDITRFVSTMNNVSCDAATRRGQQVVRIVGIYEAKAFKDWSSDPYNAYDSNKLKKHIADMVKLVKEDKGVKKKRPISYVKAVDMKVR